jgi:hypothetical protein
MERIILKIFLVLMTPVWLALAVGLVFGPPAALVWETYDMLSMSATTAATVRKSEVNTGAHGTSRPVIRYAYRVGGVAYESDRYLPGFAGNFGEWSGGGMAAWNFPVGREVVIHYRPAEPAHSCLEFGWHKWSLGLTLALCGTALAVFLQRRFWPTFSAAGFSIPLPVLAGLLLIGIGPNAVRPAVLPWYLLGLVLGSAALYGVVWLYRLVR